MTGGWKLKFKVFFYGDNSWTVLLKQMKFSMDIPISFIWITFSLTTLLNMAMVRISEVMLR
jgi:hypothetical protein